MQALVENIDQNLDGKELSAILRFGAKRIFEETETEQVYYDDNAVDELLLRDKPTDANAASSDTAGANDEFFASFNVANVWSNDASSTATLQEDDEQFWKQLIQSREAKAAEAAATSSNFVSRKARRSRTKNYSQFYAIADDLPDGKKSEAGSANGKASGQASGDVLEDEDWFLTEWVRERIAVARAENPELSDQELHVMIQEEAQDREIVDSSPAKKPTDKTTHASGKAPTQTAAVEEQHVCMCGIVSVGGDFCRSCRLLYNQVYSPPCLGCGMTYEGRYLRCPNATCTQSLEAGRDPSASPADLEPTIITECAPSIDPAAIVSFLRAASEGDTLDGFTWYRGDLFAYSGPFNSLCFYKPDVRAPDFDDGLPWGPGFWWERAGFEQLGWCVSCRTLVEPWLLRHRWELVGSRDGGTFVFYSYSKAVPPPAPRVISNPTLPLDMDSFTTAYFSRIRAILPSLPPANAMRPVSFARAWVQRAIASRPSNIELQSLSAILSMVKAATAWYMSWEQPTGLDLFVKDNQGDVLMGLRADSPGSTPTKEDVKAACTRLFLSDTKAQSTYLQKERAALQAGPPLPPPGTEEASAYRDAKALASKAAATPPRAPKAASKQAAARAAATKSSAASRRSPVTGRKERQAAGCPPTGGPQQAGEPCRGTDPPAQNDGSAESPALVSTYAGPLLPATEDPTPATPKEAGSVGASGQAVGAGLAADGERTSQAKAGVVPGKDQEPCKRRAATEEPGSPSPMEAVKRPRRGTTEPQGDNDASSRVGSPSTTYQRLAGGAKAEAGPATLAKAQSSSQHAHRSVRTKNLAKCPNSANDFHTCTWYCQRRFTPDQEQALFGPETLQSELLACRVHALPAIVRRCTESAAGARPSLSPLDRCTCLSVPSIRRLGLPQAKTVPSPLHPDVVANLQGDIASLERALEAERHTLKQYLATQPSTDPGVTRGNA